MNPPTETVNDAWTRTTSSVSHSAVTILANENHNLTLLSIQQIMLRTAWIFKTESVIIPAFVDAIAGAGWIRGCLPVLNRIGQSVPQVLLADRLHRAPRKKWPMFFSTFTMGFPFLILAASWFATEGSNRSWMPVLFLALYTVFFAANGLNLLSFGTIQGKLIRPFRRGRLMGTAGLVGSITAIAGAAVLLPNWLERPDGGFGHIFALCGIGFSIAALACLGIREPAGTIEPRAAGRVNHFGRAWELFRSNVQFRRLAIVAMLSVTAQMLFPHYQALGRTRLQIDGFDLMLWVTVQNAGTGLFSMIAGMIGDRYGNRLAIRLEVLTIACIPTLSIAIANGWFGNGDQLYVATFFLLGLAPVTLKTFNNFALELADEREHARYVSTLILCMALPFAFSPLVGWMIDVAGFETVFGLMSCLIAAGGLLTFWMIEPRYLVTAAPSEQNQSRPSGL